MNVQETVWMAKMRCTEDRYWMNGTLEDALLPDFELCGENYGFSAKVYDEGSEYGINNGRVSKLDVRRNRPCCCHSRKEPIAHYDRGWALQPTNEKGRVALRRIVDGLEGVPKWNLPAWKPLKYSEN